MEVKLSNHDWQLLRRVHRAKGKPVLGKELRMDMSRRTRDGAFLTVLVDEGLIAVAVPSSEPFVAKYVLTDLGRHAAEYGVYEVEWEAYKARS